MGHPAGAQGAAIDPSTEARLTQFAMDRAGEAVFWMGADGRFVYVNEAACRSLGFTAEELKKMSVADISPDYPTEGWRVHWQQVKKEKVFTFETRHQRKDGSFLPVEITVNYLEFEGKEMNCAFVRDISERHYADRQLRFTQFAVDQASEAVFWMDMPSRRFVYVNETASRMLGYSRAELLTMTVPDIDSDFKSPEGEERFRPVEKPGYRSFESRHRRKDGSRFPVDISICYIEFEGRDYCCAYVRDATERKRAEERLRFAQFTVDQAGEAVFCVEIPSQKFVYVNNAACRSLGYSREELLQLGVSDIDPDFNAINAPQQREAIRLSGTHSFESRHRRKDGTLLPVEVTLNYMSFEGEEFAAGLYACVHVRDIAERKRIEARIQQAQKLESLGVLAGGVAHDFNNLLTGILGNASLAQMELPEDFPVRQQISQIEKAALHAADLTQQMLAYSGRGKVVIESVDLSELVREMTLIETLISKKAILQYDLAPDLPPVEVDATQIRQVVTNLITNASDAIGDSEGRIRVATGVMEADRVYLTETYLDAGLPVGPYVYLQVTDTGAGMEEETRTKMFDPFFTTKFPGRGLGLAAVLGIVRGHNGAIKVRSQTGHGTTIRFLLPAADAGVTESGQVSTDSQPQDKSGKVLVVDDEDTVRTFTRSVLEHFGFSVLLAPGGKEAVEIYRDQGSEISAVVLDVTMPHPDGAATLELLRRLDPQVRVLLMSGYNQEDIESRFTAQGPTAFVHKPFRPQAFMTKLRVVLEGGCYETTSD